MKRTAINTNLGEWLIFWGILLFCLGLIIGLFIPLLANPRMGLTTHLEGIMNGLFLVVLGLIWNKIYVSVKWLQLTYGFAIFGSFANFLAVLIAAVTGAGKLMPIAGGREGKPLTEILISFLLFALTLAMLTVCTIILTGLFRYLRIKN